MSTATETIIWFDRSREHFYAIPKGTEVEAGDLKLHNLRGQVWRVDPAAVSAWALSREAASERVGERIDSAWGELRSAWSRLLDVGQKTAGVELSGENRPELPQDLANVLGISPGELLTEPGLIREKIRRAMFGDDFSSSSSSSSSSAAPASSSAAPAGEDSSPSAAGESSSSSEDSQEVPPEVVSLEDLAKKAEETMRGVFQSPEFGSAVAGLGAMLRRAGQKLQEAAEGLEE